MYAIRSYYGRQHPHPQRVRHQRRQPGCESPADAEDRGHAEQRGGGRGQRQAAVAGHAAAQAEVAVALGQERRQYRVEQVQGTDVVDGQVS